MKKGIFISVILACVGLLLASCNKEKTCSCMYERMYGGDDNIYAINVEVKIDKGSCEDIANFGLSDSPDEYFETTCTEKIE